MHTTRTDELQPWIERLRNSDETARAELLDLSSRRLLRLTRKMLRDYPGVKRWEDTDDVFQNASMRLYRGMKTAQFDSVVDFLRFAAVLIRRELIDLSRHYSGPHGHGRNHSSRENNRRSESTDRLDPANDTHEPGKLAQWTEFHQTIENLEESDKELFDLLWYQELTQAEAAKVMGVSERTIQRRWQNARLKLHSLLTNQLKQP